MIFRACEGDGKGEFRKNQALASYRKRLSYAELL